MIKSKYEELTNALKNEISSGKLKAGDRLMSRSEMERHYGVSPTTINRALAALSAEGLIVRKKGKGCFVSKRTRTNIAVLICPLGTKPSKTDISPFLVNAVGKNLDGTGLNLMLLNSQDVEASFEEAVNMNPAGIIINCEDPEALKEKCGKAAELGIPVIFMDKSPRTFSAGFAGTDHYKGTYCAINEVLKYGCRNIYHFSDISNMDSIVKRRFGYVCAMAGEGLNSQLIMVDMSSGAAEENYYKAMLEYGEILNNQCAIFTTNGQGMKGLWTAVSELKPKYYPILISFDDPDIALPSGLLFVNIIQDLEKIGKAAVDMLLAYLNDDVELSEIKIMPRIKNGQK